MDNSIKAQFENLKRKFTSNSEPELTTEDYKDMREAAIEEADKAAELEANEGDEKQKINMKPDSLVDFLQGVSIYIAESTGNENFYMADQVAAHISRSLIPVINKHSSPVGKYSDEITAAWAIFNYGTQVWKGVYRNPEYNKRNKLTFHGIGMYYQQVEDDKKKPAAKPETKKAPSKKTKGV